MNSEWHQETGPRGASRWVNASTGAITYTEPGGEEPSDVRPSEHPSLRGTSPQMTERWVDGSAPAAYRIQDAKKPMPARSANMWEGAAEGATMAGTSAYASFGPALADFVLGAKESVTGENYTQAASESGGDPQLWVLLSDSRFRDAPGAETLVTNAVPAMKIDRPLAEQAVRQALHQQLVEGGDESASDALDMDWKQIRREFDLNDSDLMDRAEAWLKRQAAEMIK